MKKILGVLLFLAILLVACSKDEDQTTDHEEKDIGTEPKEEIEVEVEGENRYPLTGLYTNDSVDNRIIGVMVNNHSEARPQSGLSKADIVFEILAEGKITRFLALFQSEIPDVIGPVRSAREYYFDLADRYNALYVYHGAADFVDQMIINQGISFLNGSTYDNDGKLFKRESFRKAPHNSYVLTDAVYGVAEGKGYETTVDYEPLPFLEEEEIEGIAGEPAQHVEIVYSENPMEIVEFSFDEANGSYKRYNDREQTVEMDTGTPIEVKNVFIIEAFHQVIDDQGRRAIDLDSGGNAYLLQDGKVQQLQWENEGGRLIPVKDGKKIGFVPGKTWINVVPTNPSIEESVTISNPE